MAEPRKVPFVTLSAFAPGQPSEQRKRRREDDTDISVGDAGLGTAATGAAGGGMFAKAGDGDAAEPRGITVRLDLRLSEPSDQASAEFNYSELLQSVQVKKPAAGLPPVLDPSDPFGDDERERQEVEALAKKFESKYGNQGKKKRKDRMQDLIDIGFGYDESDPFIDNSEAYDELVPASLTTKLGGFYINTGTLQFRAASESEGEEMFKDGKPHKKLKDGEDQVIKKRKKKEGNSMEEKKPRKNRVSKQGVSSLNRPEKKKRKKLMKDSLCLAAMIRRFNREKEEMRKKNFSANTVHHGSNAGPPPTASAGQHSTPAGAVSSDLSIADLPVDPAVMSLLGSANESELQELLGDLDFSLLDSSPQSSSPAQRENGLHGSGAPVGHKVVVGPLGRGQGVAGASGELLTPPPLPDGLPAPLAKRIEDLRAASRQFDQEGRKKFFTLDMNNILLDIELQVQEQPASVRAAVYSHLEAFVPCNKEALLKRLKKLSLNIQDDRLRAPLLKLKLAVCSVMPEQIAQYNMDCMAKAAKQQSEEGEKNGSEEEDEEKPGKRVMGPRKKFVWNDKLRSLLCNLVRVKLGCYELESQCSVSVEDYLKAFMENEVKPLWPKGWMQTRMLFKESRSVHSHLTGNLAKKKIVPTPKAKPKEGMWPQRPLASAAPAPSPAPIPAIRRPPSSPSETICLSDSLDEDLTAPSLDSISHALALLSNAAKGLAQSDSPPSPPAPKMLTSTPGPPVAPYASLVSQSTLLVKKEASGLPLANMNTPSTSPSSSSSSSPCLPRPPSVSSSPSSSVAASVVHAEAYGILKGGGSLPQSQRHPMPPMPPTHRPGVTGVSKLSQTGSPSPPKPRPPPTASPLLPPQKAFCPTGVKAAGALAHSGLVKSGTKANANSSSGGVPISPQSRMNSHTPQLNPKSLQAPRLPHGPSPVQAPSHPQSKAHPHHQSNFITPMQATLTKSPHSSSSPIIKLTPRPPAPTLPPSSSPSPSPSLTAHSRPQPIPQVHQYSPKNPGFRPPFSVPSAGGAAKPGQGTYSLVGGHKAAPHTGGATTNATPASSPSNSSRPTSSPSPTVSANHGQRQRSVSGASQGPKPVASRAPVTPLPASPATSQLSQVSSASGNLLGTPPPSLPLGFGMLGGLVPVSLPFQFPPLLNFTPPGAASGVGAPGANSSGYSLAQNLLKSLQSGSQAALPPHLQLAFSDANQSQGADMTRKSH